MSSVDDLLADYIAEHRAGGEADPRAYLARAMPENRIELAALIDAYLTRAPRQAFDPELFRGSTAERTVEELERVIAGSAGLWPALLPRLRARAGLKRNELVRRLATSLGFDDRSAKVGSYYHQMEQGLLPADGVSPRVLDALSQIIGETAQALREAGRPIGQARGPGAPPPAPAAFARRTRLEVDTAAVAASSAREGEDEWDEIDALFRGG
jgi:hypothetical protein